MGSESFAANYANYANRRVKDSIDAPVRVVRVIRGKILVAAYAALNFALLFPSLQHRKEGWLRHQRKFGEATEADAAGVVFLLDSSENHPTSR